MNQKHRFDLSPFIVTPDKYQPLSSFDPGYTDQLKNERHGKKALKEDVSNLAKAQELIWASKQHSVLLILQAMDTAGKDGTIKHVMSGINPQGCDVFSFKAPSEEERLHHFLWRPNKYLPPRGKIAIFNRSYYEEVLVVRVHPELLDKSWLPVRLQNAPMDDVWRSRYNEIREFEERISKNGIIVIKVFLHISKNEQTRRFLKRLRLKEKNWKFSASDFEERKYWDQYQQVYEEMLNATSTGNCPWYVVPADNKWYSRAVVADIITSRIESLDLHYPEVSTDHAARLEKIRAQFEEELNVQEEEDVPG